MPDAVLGILELGVDVVGQGVADDDVLDAGGIGVLVQGVAGGLPGHEAGLGEDHQLGGGGHGEGAEGGQVQEDGR